MRINIHMFLILHVLEKTKVSRFLKEIQKEVS